MEAKDTIIKADVYLPMWKKNGGRIDLICEKQAEISFKAGEEAERGKHIRPFTMTEEEKLQNLINKLIEARRDGMKEVVDWVEENVEMTETRNRQWDKQKKELGIK
jgi:hypothetical protein